MKIIKKQGKRIIKLILITLASILYAAGISLLIDPNNMSTGGVTGLSIIVSRLSGMETGTLIFLFNIPIMILGIWKLGWKMIVTTIYSIAVTAVFTNFFSQFPPLTTEIVPTIMAASCISGASLGIIFKCGATTGGTDIIVKLLRLKFKHVRTGRLFFMVDMIIVITAGIVFRNFNTSIYALILVIGENIVLDAVLYGRDEAKMIFIISDHGDRIATKLMNELDLGVTFLDGEGAYSKKEKKVILCVMQKKIAPMAEEIIKEVDGNAFMIVSSASEIFGEGYKNIYADKL